MDDTSFVGVHRFEFYCSAGTFDFIFEVFGEVSESFGSFFAVIFCIDCKTFIGVLVFVANEACEVLDGVEDLASVAYDTCAVGSDEVYIYGIFGFFSFDDEVKAHTLKKFFYELGSDFAFRRFFPDEDFKFIEKETVILEHFEFDLAARRKPEVADSFFDSGVQSFAAGFYAF